MNASEMAFKFYGGWPVALSDIGEWTRFTPADWVCLLYGVIHSSGDEQKIMDALCQSYAPELKDAPLIIFHYGPDTAMKGRVCTATDGGAAQGFGWVYGDPSWTYAKRFVAPWGSNETFAGVFATYDNSGAIIALSVGIESKQRVVRTDPPPAPRVGF